jgi:hypothetical protein
MDEEPFPLSTLNKSLFLAGVHYFVTFFAYNPSCFGCCGLR